MKLMRTVALALAAVAVAALLWIFARRVAWPYDLEWMEGGMLCHALRLASGQPIYAPPSVDFVPYLYTPFYPAMVALFGKLFGVGYGLGRALSLLGFGGAWVLAYVFARREGGSRATAFAAMALPAAAYVPTGAWYDLARPDSLFLGLTTAGLLVGWWMRRRHLGGVIAALLLIAAFFTKQTASPFMITLGLALLVASPRVAVTYGLTLAAVGLPLLWLLNHGSDGWFWTYVFKLHQQHDFYPRRAFVASPVRLLLLLGPAALTVPWALARRRSPGLLFATLVAGAGAAAACVGFGTQWAFTNAFIPGVFFPAMAIGVAAGRLVTAPAVPVGARPGAPAPRLPRHRPTAVFLTLACSIAVAPGILVRWAGPRVPRDWGFIPEGNVAQTGYDPRPYLPTAADRKQGDAVLERLRATPGDVLIPFHPFYAHLAGKRTFLHRMGVLDIGRAGMGAPRGLVEAIQQHRFAIVLMDDKIDGNYQTWPGLLAAYHKSENLVGARMFSGAMTHPRDLLVPTLALPPPAPDAAAPAPATVGDREP